MYNDSEFVGRLEMIVLSRMYKIKFNIYLLHTNEDETQYTLVNTIGVDSHRVCNLVLDENHYYMLDNDEVADIRPSTPVHEISLIDSDHENEILSDDDDHREDGGDGGDGPVEKQSIVAATESDLEIVDGNIELSTIQQEDEVIVSMNMEDEDNFHRVASKGYVNEQIEILRRELKEEIAKNNSLEREMYEQIRLSASISSSLGDLIRKLNKSKTC